MKTLFKKGLLTVLALSFLVGTASAAEYAIDASHSTLGFAVKHLQVGTTRGVFADYSGTISFDPADYSTFKADATIQVSSIDTNNEKRDGHLKSGDFFEAETYPTITFASTRLEKSGEGAVIVGNLTIKGITKEISIPVSVVGPVEGMGGGMVVGIAGETTINRQDFGVSWSKTLDGGGLVVGDEVKLTIEIEAHAK